ncbi:hypothetical protein [Nonlabens sp. SY33080]|uniref:hypothetical protein n=1 Tax=Nonlabens sp. SY33080 TaxID=2719911 RepID=UPI001428CBE5|nr:hypothetical protein [Nonlabens sp. SY33080]
MMTTDHLSWTMEQFRVYLILYCSKIDISQSCEELKWMQTHFDKERYEEMLLIFRRDADYKSIVRIEEYIKHNNLSKPQVEKILHDVKDFFTADGSYDIMEQHLMNVLKSIFKG